MPRYRSQSCLSWKEPGRIITSDYFREQSEEVQSCVMPRILPFQRGGHGHSWIGWKDRCGHAGTVPQPAGHGQWSRVWPVLRTAAAELANVRNVLEGSPWFWQLPQQLLLVVKGCDCSLALLHLFLR